MNIPSPAIIWCVLRGWFLSLVTGMSVKGHRYNVIPDPKADANGAMNLKCSVCGHKLVVWYR